MDVKSLRQAHSHHEENVGLWNYYRMAYDGGKPFIEAALGGRHPRESTENYMARLADGILINYNAAIIDIFNYYLTEKTPLRDLTKLGLGNDDQWKMFLKSCDYNGTDFNNFINDCHRDASVCGTVGVLVTKPKSDVLTIAEEKKYRIYPYLVAYAAKDIIDWRYGKHSVSGVPCLTYLKLRESSDNQKIQRYLVWTLDSWTFYEVSKDTIGNEQVVTVDSGVNTFNEIPFVWLANIRVAGNRAHGKSDLVDVAPIVASIVRNISSGDEIIKFAGFPIFKEPMVPEGQIDNDETEVGPTAVKHFYKEYGEPGWIETAVLEPISAILSWINFKADELYRAVHLSGVHGQRKSANSQASGIALRYEFQQLKTVLGRKADSIAEAERQIIRFWCKWQGRDFNEEDIDVRRSKEFSVDDLAMDLENMIVSMKAVVSEKFRVLVQKKIARRTLVDMSDLDHKVVESEIEKSKGKIEFDETGGRRQDVPLGKTPVVQESNE